MNNGRRTIGLLVCALLWPAAMFGDQSRVTIVRAPDGGIQPQAVTSADGTIHMVYYKGDAGGGNVFYVRRGAAEASFSSPVQVNTSAGSAIAAGSIRGAQIALGRNGRVHVVWNGGKGAQKFPLRGKQETPLLYTRLAEDRTAFEPERNIITEAGGLDGGSSVAADGMGHVYVVWHGREAGSADGESGRAVFVARSSDDGKTFAGEVPATKSKTGACACCGMRALADGSGAVYILYRAATKNVERGETLLFSPKPGKPFEVTYSDPWRASVCPMSSATLSIATTGVVGAWETGTNVFFAKIDAKTGRPSRAVGPAPGPKRKHPVAIADDSGATLLVWTEGTAWAKGGTVVWQLFDENGAPTAERGRVEELPVWGLPTAVPHGDKFYVIF